MVYLAFLGIFMLLQMSVSKILASMVLQNYQTYIELTSNMIYIVSLGVGLKCPHKIHLNTQCLPSPICIIRWNEEILLHNGPTLDAYN